MFKFKKVQHTSKAQCHQRLFSRSRGFGNTAFASII
jgi:hypothetical protein